jgi:hypothetical protein
MVNDFVSKENINDFRASPIHMAMWMLWESHPTDRDHDSWKQVTRRLISMRPDHHDYSNHQGFTLLDEILNLVERPFESISIGREVLDILSDLKVELLTYLQVESKRHFDPCKPLHMLRGHEATAFRERYLVISETPPSVSWEWFIDPEGSAFDVLDEFKNFTLDLYPDEDEKEHWPIAYSNCCKYTRKWQFGEALSPKELSKLRMYNDRFQRCQYKKALKLDKAQGILRRSYKVPGAWID